MSKNSIADLGEQLTEEINIEIASSDITERARRAAGEISVEFFDSLVGLPALMSKWMGREGHEQPNIPESSVSYPPLSKKYLKSKKKIFTKRGRYLGERQAFYSYSGDLWHGLAKMSSKVNMVSEKLTQVYSVLETEEKWLNRFYDAVVVLGSLDGSHWFNLTQKNYYSLKYRIKKQLKKQPKKSKQKKVSIFYKIDVNRKNIEKLFLEELGGKNFIKLKQNDVWRPFLTPSLKYLVRKEVSDKLTKIVKESFRGYRIFQSESR